MTFEKWLHVLRFSKRYAKMTVNNKKEQLKEEDIFDLNRKRNIE
jgi:hypothetical protein